MPPPCGANDQRFADACALVDGNGSSNEATPFKRSRNFSAWRYCRLLAPRRCDAYLRSRHRLHASEHPVLYNFPTACCSDRRRTMDGGHRNCTGSNEAKFSGLRRLKLYIDAPFIGGQPNHSWPSERDHGVRNQRLSKRAHPMQDMHVEAMERAQL